MKSNFAKIVNSETLVLVDFFATWCGPCKTMVPILKQAKDTLGPMVKIIKIDIDKNTSLAQRYQILGVPTLVLFKNGEPVWRKSGVLPSQEIVSVVQSQTS